MWYGCMLLLFGIILWMLLVVGCGLRKVLSTVRNFPLQPVSAISEVHGGLWVWLVVVGGVASIVSTMCRQKL